MPRFPLAALAAALAVVMFVFPLAIYFPLLDPDEGLHASIALDMVERGDWITPHFLGRPFLDKPIFYFWVEAASLRLFGVNETAVRLPGLMFGLLGGVTTGLLAWRWFGRATGWIAGILYATTILPTAMAQAASHNVALVPWVNLSLLFLWEAEGKGVRNLLCGDNRTEKVPDTFFAFFAGVFLGLSILTKGLMGVAVVGLAYGGYRLCRAWALRKGTVPFSSNENWDSPPLIDLPALTRIALLGGGVLLIAALVAAPWYLAVESQNPGFLRYYFLDRHLLGLATDTQPHSDQPWWYYLPILLGGGLPWIGYLPVAWGAGGGRRRIGEEIEEITTLQKGTVPFSSNENWDSPPLPSTHAPRSTLHSPRSTLHSPLSTLHSPLSTFHPPLSPLPLLWCWLLGWTALLTVAQSKLASYLWLAFPPVAILAAVAWAGLIDGTLSDAARRRFARTFVWSSWSGPIVLPAAVLAVQWLYAVQFAWPAWAAVGLAAAATPLPLVAWRAGRWQAALTAAALSLAVQFVVVMTMILPPLADVLSARELAEHYNRFAKLPTRLLVAEERIGSLMFYLTPSVRAGLKDGQIQRLWRDHPPPLQSGDVIALPEQGIRRAGRYLKLGQMPYESVGRYRLYHVRSSE